MELSICMIARNGAPFGPGPCRPWRTTAADAGVRLKRSITSSASRSSPARSTNRPVDWLISASPMSERRWLAKPSWMLCLRPSRDIELGLRAHLRASLRAMPLVIVEPLDRLIGLAKALGVIGPDRFGDVVHVVRPQEEVARQNVPPEQIHHLGLAIRPPRSRSGRRPEG